MEQTIAKLLTDRKYHDVEFIFPKEESATLSASKQFLAINSEVWDKMFYSENWKDSGKTKTIVQITIEDAKYEMFEIFLRYCYLKEITLTQDNVLPILLISETYMHKELIQKANSYILGQNKDFDFKLRILGEMSELGEIEIESVQSLKDNIKQEIKDNPFLFLSKTNFSNLSPAIMDTICDLLSIRALPLHERHRLSRIIEYGEALKKSPDNADKEIKEIVAPLMKYVKFIELTETDFIKLLKYSLLTYEETCKYALEIMKKNLINRDHIAKSKKLEFSLASFQGSMMDLYNINPNTDLKNWEETWCLNIKENTELKITFLQPQLMCYIACELKEPYEGIVLEISYSENGRSWQVDSLHYPSYDTCRRDEKLHLFFIKTRKEYQYWKFYAKSTHTQTNFYDASTILGKNFQISIAE